jgi:hypothetical protein
MKVLACAAAACCFLAYEVAIYPQAQPTPGSGSVFSAAGPPQRPTLRPGQPTGLKGPYLGQPIPGRTPAIFAPGLVSVPDAKASACSFSPDLKEFYFTRAGSRLMVSRLTDEGWTFPAPVTVSEGDTAFAPHVTADNKRLYWNWNKPFPSIYVSERSTDGWGPGRLAGEGMFVSSDREGNLYVTHLSQTSDFVSRARMAGNRIAGYEDLKGAIERLRSRSDSIAHPCIAPDGSYIVFDIDAGSHLFVSFRQPDGTWGEAIDMAEHGLDIKAGQASISPDGKYLFFGKGPDLYWVSTEIIDVLRPNPRAPQPPSKKSTGRGRPSTSPPAQPGRASAPSPAPRRCAWRSGSRRPRRCAGC